MSNLNTVGRVTTTNKNGSSIYSAAGSDLIGSRIDENLITADFLKDWISKSLEEEDKDKTLSRLITSIVIDKMYELSGKTEEELVETLLFKKLSDSFSNRLTELELSINQLRNEIQMLKWKDERLGYTQRPDTTQYPYTTQYEPTTAITGFNGSDFLGESFTLTKEDYGLTYKPNKDEEKKSILSKLKDLFKNE